MVGYDYVGDLIQKKRFWGWIQCEKAGMGFAALPPPLTVSYYRHLLFLDNSYLGIGGIYLYEFWFG